MSFVYDVCNVKLQLYAKGLACSMGESISKHLFLYYRRKTGFSTHIFNQYLPNVKTLFADNLRAEQNTFLMGKNIIFFETFIGHFMGNPALRLFEVFNTYSIMNGKIHQNEKGQNGINIV